MKKVLQSDRKLIVIIYRLLLIINLIYIYHIFLAFINQRHICDCRSKLANKSTTGLKSNASQ